VFREQIAELQTRLHADANPETKAWWESYVKESAPFLGVKMPIIRSIVHQWHKDNIAGNFLYPEQVDLALALFEGEYTEDKLAGTLFLQEILLPAGVVSCNSDIDRFAILFDSGKIYDWNTCDWFCVKVLGPLIQKNGMECANRISKWRDAKNLWRARSSLVAFVKVAGEYVYYPDIEASCQVLIRREERFAKTAVGWILRDISKYDKPFVQRLVEENIQHFSSEAIKNATKYFSKETQQDYLEMLKNS
jgi:3-methyladenine DNA glycosylase AlkD